MRKPIYKNAYGTIYANRAHQIRSQAGHRKARLVGREAFHTEAYSESLSFYLCVRVV